MLTAQQIIDDTEKYSVHNYDRYPFVAHKAKGVSIYGLDGKPKMDMLCTYGAVGGGHDHPRIVSALVYYLRSGFIASMPGGFYNPAYSQLVRTLAEFSGCDKVMLKCSGTEAVGAAVKLARRYGYQVKGVPRHENAEIIGCVDNFHGRMLAALALSTVPKYKKDFGPFPPGFTNIFFNDPDALGRAIKPNTVAFIFEVVQGEGGIKLWSADALKEVEKICRKHNVLMIDDEIQAGLGRTGYNFAYEHEGIKPDIVILAKFLGGEFMPVSAVLANNSVMDLIGPGDEGSTFGSHPLSCFVAKEVIDILVEEKLAEQAATTGNYFMSKLREMKSPMVKEVRGRGLMIGVEFVSEAQTAKYYINELLKEGIICEKTGHGINAIRFTPPLNITKEEIDWAMERIERVFKV